jgi:hypothetical protein
VSKRSKEENKIKNKKSTYRAKSIYNMQRRKKERVEERGTHHQRARQSANMYSTG